MERYKRNWVLFFSVILLAAGCVSSSLQPQQEAPRHTQDQGLINTYIAQGENFENQGLFTSALEQYELALTVDPENLQATQHKQQVQFKLRRRAEDHYHKGVALDEQGKYEAARKEYLIALQNWPDYEAAKEKLTPGGVSADGSAYITHTLTNGESVSKLALLYYGDLSAYPVIGKFNHLEDVTKVRVGQKQTYLASANQKNKEMKAPETRVEKEPSAEEKNVKERTVEAHGTIEPTDTTVKNTIDPSQNTSVQDTSTLDEMHEAKLAEQGDAEQADKDNPEAYTGRYTQGHDVIENGVVRKEETQASDVSQDNPPHGQQTLASLESTSSSYDTAIELFNIKKYAQAIPLFESARASDPDNAVLRKYLFDSHFQLGLSQFNSKQFLLAKQSFETALSYDVTCDMCPEYIEKSESTYKEKHYNLGIHYFGKEQLEKAIEEWKRVKQLDPDYKSVSANLKKAELLHERLESIKKGQAQ